MREGRAPLSIQDFYESRQGWKMGPLPDVCACESCLCLLPLSHFVGISLEPSVWIGEGNTGEAILCIFNSGVGILQRHLRRLVTPSPECRLDLRDTNHSS